MRLKPRTIATVILTTGIILGILSGIQFGWEKFYHYVPAVAKISNLLGIEAVNLKPANTGKILEVKVGNVPNIRKTSLEILDIAAGDKVLLIDKRTPELQNVLETVKFNIEEAIAIGSFSTLNQSVAEISRAAGLDNSRVFIDSSYIYLQLQKSDSYLYEVFPRSSKATQLINNS